MSLKALLISFLFSNLAHASPLHVMIDPGHGGNDNGAVYGDIKESDVALKVSLELKKLMEAKGDFKVTMTRTTDSQVSLEERVKKAEAQKADIFLSLHANASKDLRARGVEFYFQNHLAADEESMYLANMENKMYQQVGAEETDASASDLSKKSDVLAIVEDLKRNTKMHQSHSLSQKLMQSLDSTQKQGSRIIRQAPFYVISKTRIPSVLVELGFISNPTEAAQLQQSAYQKRLARKIFEGVKDYKEMVDKSELRSLH